MIQTTISKQQRVHFCEQLKVPDLANRPDPRFPSPEAIQVLDQFEATDHPSDALLDSFDVFWSKEKVKGGEDLEVELQRQSVRIDQQSRQLKRSHAAFVIGPKLAELGSRSLELKRQLKDLRRHLWVAARARKKVDDTWSSRLELFRSEIMPLSLLEMSRRFSGAQKLGDRYAKELLEEIRRRYSRVFDFTLAHEQALPLTCLTNHVLVRARAGSGKTRVITAAAAGLIQMEGVPQDEVLILAFNRKAAKEVKERLVHKLGLKSFQNARTFHSLAYGLTQPEEEILMDSGMADGFHALSARVQSIVRDTMTDEQVEKLYLMFRADYDDLERHGHFLSDQELYEHHKAAAYQTINGKTVKSRGEKIIGDFLFENGVNFEYEPRIRWGDSIYRPDFRVKLPGNKRFVIIEHWAIRDGQGVPTSWDTSSSKYLQEAENKRAFWQANPDAILVETVADELARGREAFEALIKGRLETAGIVLRAIPFETLITLCRDNHIANFTKRTATFLSIAKKMMLSPKQLSERLNSRAWSDRVKIFFELSMPVARTYQSYLKDRNETDFDQLLLAAADAVSSGTTRYPIDHSESRWGDVTKLKWIFIDEFQDFSKPFFTLIEAILAKAPGARVFAVGDAWQGINGWAGASQKFFDEYEFLFPGSVTLDLLTNHRSATSIVELSNEIMKGKGSPAITRADATYGGVFQVDASNFWIDEEKDGRCLPDSEQSQAEGQVDWTLARLVKACAYIIDTEWNGAEKIAVVSRTNHVHSLKNLAAFKARLRRAVTGEELLKDNVFETTIQVDTAHRMKGAEAGITIVLNVSDGNFPTMHPDNDLFEPLGRLISDVYEEERRLAYVACSRAERLLFLVTDGQQRLSSIIDWSQCQSFGPTSQSFQFFTGEIPF